MAVENLNKLVKLGGLKAALEKVNSTFETKTVVSGINNRVGALEKVGSQANVIEKIQVNGADQEITGKTVNITMPTKVGDLTNDKKYQTDTEVETSIKAAIAASGHAHFEKADSVPDASTAKENTLYLVMNETTHYYDIYAKVGAEVVRLDDTTVDLSNYVTKEAGKGLSHNDFTDELKTKLDGIAEGANKYIHPTHTAAKSGLYKVTVDTLGHVTATTAVVKADITGLGIPAQDTTYVDATTTVAGLMSTADKSKLDTMELASEEEVSAMLTEVFGA